MYDSMTCTVEEHETMLRKRLLSHQTASSKGLATADFVHSCIYLPMVLFAGNLIDLAVSCDARQRGTCCSLTVL